MLGNMRIRKFKTCFVHHWVGVQNVVMPTQCGPDYLEELLKYYTLKKVTTSSPIECMDT